MKIIRVKRDGVHPGCEVAPRLYRRSPQAAGCSDQEAHAHHTGNNNWARDGMYSRQPPSNCLGQGFLTFSIPEPHYPYLMTCGPQVCNEDRLLKLHNSLLNMILTYCYKHFHILIRELSSIKLAPPFHLYALLD